MKITAVTTSYPVLNQEQPQGYHARRPGRPQEVPNTVSQPAAVNPANRTYAPYNQSRRTTLTTRGHFVDQYI